MMGLGVQDICITDCEEAHTQQLSDLCEIQASDLKEVINPKAE